MTAKIIPKRWAVEMPDGCNINVTQASQGKHALLMIHGFGEHSYAWPEVPQAIASAYSLVYIDLRGHGDSNWGPAATYHLDNFASDVTAVVDRLGIRSFAIAGHSLGADVALRIAMLRRRSLTRLILVEFSLEPTPEDALEFFLTQFAAQFRIYSSTLEYDALLQEQRPLADHTALLRYSSNSLRHKPDGSYEVKCDPALRTFHQADRDELSRQAREEIAALSCPLLLVRGSGSAIVTRAAAEKVVTLAPNAQLAQIPGAGHAVMLDRPKEFNNIVARFLSTPDSLLSASQQPARVRCWSA